MKVGVFTVILQSMPFEQALDYLAGLGVQTVEIGAGGYCGTAHCQTEALLASDHAAKGFLNSIRSRGLEISCLSTHGNPLHPNREIAQEHHAAFERCLRLANQLEVEVVTTFSGCPGGAAGDQRPNWVTCPWPPDFLEILDYQWNQVAIPYWQGQLNWRAGTASKKSRSRCIQVLLFTIPQRYSASAKRLVRKSARILTPLILSGRESIRRLRFERCSTLSGTCTPRIPASKTGMFESMEYSTANIIRMKVHLVGKSAPDILSGVVMGAGSGTMPEVITTQYAFAGSLVKAGLVKDIASEWVAMPPAWQKQFSPWAVKILATDKKLLGIPLTGYATMVFRSLTVLKKAGIDPAGGIKDWADWRRFDSS